MISALDHDTPQQREGLSAIALGENRRLATVVIAFVIVPILLLLPLGILVLVLGHGQHNYIVGSAILALGAMALGGISVASTNILRQVTISRLQTDLVSRLGHDLRTPLSSIRLFIETLQLGRVAEPSVRQHCLNIVSRECTPLSALVDQVLAWARLNAGQRPYNTETCCAVQILEEALGTTAARSRSRANLVEALRSASCCP